MGVMVMIVLIKVLVIVGMLLIVPIGLRLLDDPAAELARRIWPVGAAFGAVSLWLPRGSVATALATAYATAAAVLCAYAISRPISAGHSRRGRSSPSGPVTRCSASGRPCSR